MSGIDRVRIMVLGDSGVGKTSFVHMAANNEPIKTPGWTVGCSVEVKLHEYKEGTPGQVTYFVELWDVGGSANHRNTRPVFYTPCHGVILVHDLTNRKSEENLGKWLYEISNKDTYKDRDASLLSMQSFEDADPENFLGSVQIPILVIGTKLDLVDDKKCVNRTSKLGNQFDAEEILLDCRQPRYMAAGTTNAVKLSRFYDRVIEKQYYSRNSVPSYNDRFNSLSPNLPPRFYATTHQD